MNRPAALLTLAAAVFGPAAGRAQDAPLPHVRIALNPKFTAYVPIFVAVDKGYFRAAGVVVDVVPFFDSSADQMALLIRGDIDMMPILAGPALFNGYQSGIALKLIASTSQPTTTKGYADVQAVMVRQDLWDSRAIRTLADLKGRAIDGATRGSALHVLGLELLRKANLTQADVRFTNKATGPADQYSALANKAIDVQMTTEPNATLLQQKGIAVKWLSAADVMPWFQDSYLAVAAAYVQSHRDVLQRFLTGYVRGVTDVQKSHGALTPEMTAIIAKWSQLPPDVIGASGGLPYFGQNGAISTEALSRLQAIWIAQKLVQTPIDIAQIYDTSFLRTISTAPG